MVRIGHLLFHWDTLTTAMKGIVTEQLLKLLDPELLKAFVFHELEESIVGQG